VSASCVSWPGPTRDTGDGWSLPAPIHGEPITFGFKVAGWLAEKPCATRGTAGAVGDGGGRGADQRSDGHLCANTDPEVEALTCQRLGLVPTHVSAPRLIGRDRHVPTTQTWLWRSGNLLESPVSTEIRNACNCYLDDLLEVRERLCRVGATLRVSSACHTRNPIRDQRAGANQADCARVLPHELHRGRPGRKTLALLGMSGTSAQLRVERMMLPDCFRHPPTSCCAENDRS